jgi:hypothetical protein
MYYHKSIDIIDEELRTTQENLKDENIYFNYNNKTTSNKTIREKPLVSINNLGKSFKKL